MHQLLRHSVLIFLLLFTIATHAVYSQIKVTSPAVRSVYQRETGGQTNVPISGYFTAPVNKVEVRAIPVIAGQGQGTDWTTLQDNPTGGVFSGSLRLFGGWYTLEVRGFLNSELVGRDIVERVGVGEVFIISGQSNAQGIEDSYYNSPRANDDRVSYISYDNTAGSLSDPPYPTFQHLETNITMGPRGKGAWCWGVLGDLLVQKLNVPVLFINTAFEGTSLENWTSSAQGKPTYNAYGGFQYAEGMPYANLRISLRNYINLLGARAVLWMQGETDTYPLRTSKKLYEDNLQYLIEKVETDIGKRIYWVISRTSLTLNTSTNSSMVSQDIINAQNEILSRFYNAVYPGPETDKLPVQRADGTHITGENNLRILANAWNESLDISNFWSTITPLLPTSTPQISVECITTDGGQNSSLRMSLPAGYSSYTWSTLQTGQVISVNSPGEYRAVVKDLNGNVFHTQTVKVESVRPAKPVISHVGEQQACFGIGLDMNAAGGTNYYKWYLNGNQSQPVATTQQFKALQTGNYTVQTENVFGCKSQLSEATDLLVRDEISKPVVEKAGPFSLGAEIAETDLDESYQWKLENAAQHLPSNEDVIRVIDYIPNRTDSTYFQARAVVNYTLNNNNLTCYSAYSDPYGFFVTEDDNIVIFPNPAFSQNVSVESFETLLNVTVTLYDMNGAVVYKEELGTLDEKKTINAGYLPSGTYIMRIQSSTQTMTKRVVLY